MGAISEILSETKTYQLEPLCDDNRLRVIIWPRGAGKSYFIAIDSLRVMDFPRSHVLIVHANEDALYAMRSTWLLDIDPARYTCITYEYLAKHMQSVVEATKGKNVWIYFEEPDLFPENDEKSASVITNFCATVSMDITTAIQQVTYIGTASALGSDSRLARLSEFVNIVHVTHPREVWGEEWIARANEISGILDTNTFRTQFMGEY